MTVLRTDRKHASNCMTEENGVEKVKKRKNFFRSLRFRILIILIILGIVPGVIVTYTMLHNYQNRAVAMLTETVGDQCDILCNLIIRENYLNDTDSEIVNSKLELFSNVYNGRILLADRDFKIVSDTFHTEEGKTLLSSLAVACLKGEETSNYDARSKVLEIAVPVQSPDVQQLQGVMLVSVSAVDIAETLAEMEQRGVMLIGSIVVLSVFLAWLLSTILVKPLARVTKAIEDLTDGMLDEEISVPDYTETELITDAFNKMVNRMKILDESRQEFVSNVSHELKTPLTSMKVLADSLVGQQRILHRITVICLTYSISGKSHTFIETDCSLISHTYFQMDCRNLPLCCKADQALHQKSANSFFLSVPAHSHIGNISLIQNHKKTAVTQNLFFLFHHQKHGIIPGQKSKKTFFCPWHMKKILLNLHYLIQVIHKHFPQDHIFVPAGFCSFSLSARSRSAWETRRYSGICSIAVSVRPSL